LPAPRVACHTFSNIALRLRAIFGGWRRHLMGCSHLCSYYRCADPPIALGVSAAVRTCLLHVPCHFCPSGHLHTHFTHFTHFKKENKKKRPFYIPLNILTRTRLEDRLPLATLRAHRTAHRRSSRLLTGSTPPLACPCLPHLPTSYPPYLKHLPAFLAGGTAHATTRRPATRDTTYHTAAYSLAPFTTAHTTYALRAHLPHQHPRTLLGTSAPLPSNSDGVILGCLLTWITASRRTRTAHMRALPLRLVTNWHAA